MTDVTIAVPSATFKACCADLYGHDLVAILLGPSYHPGGLELTRRLARAGAVLRGERVLDIATGPGRSAVVMAEEFGATVLGVDLSASLVQRATELATVLGVASRATFEVADAEHLPVDDGSVDVVLCECALCLFPDKGAAVSEIARVLAPGGRLLLSDVILDRPNLPVELEGFVGRVACLADARPLEGYLELLEAGGLQIRDIEQHDGALRGMVEEIDARIRLLDRTGITAGLDIAYARGLAATALSAIERGVAGYVSLVAERAPSGRGMA